MSEAKHTPLPWSISRTRNNLYIVGDSRSGDGCTLSTRVASMVWTETSGDIPQRNAEFIVRACNSHYDLLAACKKAIETIHALHDIDVGTDEAWSIYLKCSPEMKSLTAAIAKAEGRAQ